MEEILASIRRTIAEERQGEKAASSARSDGALRFGNAPTDRAPPSLDRLSGALKSGAAQTSNFLESKRPSSFDDDLADILDETNGGKIAAPKPSFNRGSDIPGLLMPRQVEDKAPATPPEAPSPGFFPAAVATPSAPAPETPIAAAPSTSPRKPGFYPPPGYTPKLPNFPVSARVEEPTPAHDASDRDAPDRVLKRLAELGAVVPKASLTGSSVAPEVEAFAPLSRERFLAGSNAGRLDPVSQPEPDVTSVEAHDAVEASGDADEAPRPAPLRPGLAHSAAIESGPDLENVTSDPVEDLASVAAAETDGSPAGLGSAEQEPDPAALEAPNVEIPDAEPPRFVPAEPAEIRAAEPLRAAAFAPDVSQRLELAQHAEPGLSPLDCAATPAEAAPLAEPPQTAAKSPLDALAQGLAASAASKPLAPSMPESVPETATEAYSAPVSERLSPDTVERTPPLNASDPQPPPQPSVRTLEDVVTDMLKPMLQQWLADNMPRIIEKALRVEAASVLNKNAPPPPRA